MAMNDERIDFKGGFFHIAPPIGGSIGGEYDVWLNAELDYDGVCVGSGATRDDAVADARATMEGALAALRN
jgi:hypothetical protein